MRGHPEQTFIKLVFLFGVLVLIFWGCTQSGQGGRKILYYANPMVPTMKSDKPMKDPMGMDYVPVYEDEVNKEDGSSLAEGETDKKQEDGMDGYTDIKITPQKQQLIGIKQGLVERKEMTKTVRTVGKVAHETEIFNLQQEYLSSLKYYLDAKKSGSAEALNTAKLLLDSTIFKLKLQGFTAGQIDSLGRSGVSDLSLILSGGKNKSWVVAAIYEIDLPYIKPGQKVTLTSSAMPGKKFTGTILLLEPNLNPESRTAKARLLSQDLDANILHEAYVDVNIEITLGPRLVIPEDAAIDTGLTQVAFIAKEDGYFEPRKIVLGMKIGEYYEVLEGLTEGEKVVTSANFLIDSESQFKAALKQM